MADPKFSRLCAHSSGSLGEGTDEALIIALEKELGITLPGEYRQYLKEIGYAEIFGDEIYSIYEVPDTVPCCGLHWNNKENDLLSSGYIEFFRNDVDGTFYIHQSSGKVYLNTPDEMFADTFSKFCDKILDN